MTEELELICEELKNKRSNNLIKIKDQKSQIEELNNKIYKLEIKFNEDLEEKKSL